MAQSRQSYGSSTAGPSRIPRYLPTAPRVSSSSSTTPKIMRPPRVSSTSRRSDRGGPQKSSAFDDFDAPSYCNDMAAYIAEQLSAKTKFSKTDDYRIADVPDGGWRGTRRKSEATHLADVSVQTAPEEVEEEEMDQSGNVLGEYGTMMDMGETQDEIDFARTRRTREAAEAFLKQVQEKGDDSLEEESALEKEAMELFGAAEDEEDSMQAFESEESVIRPEVAAQIAGMLADEKNSNKKPIIEVIESSDAEGSYESDDPIEPKELASNDEEEDEEASDEDSGSVDLHESDDEASEKEGTYPPYTRLPLDHGSKDDEMISEDGSEGVEEAVEKEDEGISGSGTSIMGSDDEAQYVIQDDAIRQSSDVEMVATAREALNSDDSEESEHMSTYDSFANDMNLYQDQGRRDTRGDDSNDAIELLDSDEEEEERPHLNNIEVADAEVIGDSSIESDIGMAANMFEQGDAPIDAYFWTAEPGDATMMETSAVVAYSILSSSEQVAVLPDIEIEEITSREPSLIPPLAQDLQLGMTSGAHLLSLKSEINNDLPSASRPGSIVVLPGTPQRAMSVEESKRAEEDGLANDGRELLEIKQVVNDAINPVAGAVQASLESSLVSDIDSLPNKDIEEGDIETPPMEIQQGFELSVNDAEQVYREEDFDQASSMDTPPINEQSNGVAEIDVMDGSIADLPLADSEAILTDHVDYAGLAQEMEMEKVSAAEEAPQETQEDEVDDKEIITPRRSGRARTESRRNRSPSPLTSKMAHPSTPKSAKNDYRNASAAPTIDVTLEGEINMVQEEEDIKENESAPLEEDLLATEEGVMLDSMKGLHDEEVKEDAASASASPVSTQDLLDSAKHNEDDDIPEESTFDSQVDTFDSALSIEQRDEEGSNTAVAGFVVEKETPRRGRGRRRESSERRSTSPIITKRSLRSATPSSGVPFSYDSFMTTSSGDLASSFDGKAMKVNDDMLDEIEEATEMQSKQGKKRGRPAKAKVSQNVQVEEVAPIITKQSLRSATPRGTSETPTEMSITASGKKKRRSPRKSDPGGDLAAFLPEVVDEDIEEEAMSQRPIKRARTREPTEEQQVMESNDDALLDTSILEGEDSLMDVDEPASLVLEGEEMLKTKKDSRAPRRSGPRKSADLSFRIAKGEGSESDDDQDKKATKLKKAELAREKREANREKRRIEREEKKMMKETEAKEAEKEAAGLVRKRRISEDVTTFKPDGEVVEMDEEESRRPMTRRRSRRTASQTPGS